MIIIITNVTIQHVIASTSLYLKWLRYNSEHICDAVWTECLLCGEV